MRPKSAQQFYRDLASLRIIVLITAILSFVKFIECSWTFVLALIDAHEASDCTFLIW